MPWTCVTSPSAGLCVCDGKTSSEWEYLLARMYVSHCYLSMPHTCSSFILEKEKKAERERGKEIGSQSCIHQLTRRRRRRRKENSISLIKLFFPHLLSSWPTMSVSGNDTWNIWQEKGAFWLYVSMCMCAYIWPIGALAHSDNTTILHLSQLYSYQVVLK